MPGIEEIVISNLITNPDYMRKVLPFVKEEYFDDLSQKVVFKEVSTFIETYDNLPEPNAIALEVEKRKDLTEDAVNKVLEILSGLDKTEYNEDWLLDTTEKWCRERAIYNALMESVQIADGQDKARNQDAIPTIMSEALSVCFDDHVGHDYIEDSESRYDFYHRKEEKIPFDLEFFNKITKGGLPNKTLNIALAGTGVGKSLFMCHMASAALSQGYDVLYITCEMAEEKIAERIDANLLNVAVKDIVDLPEVLFTSKVNEIARKTQGKLIIKEYPTAVSYTHLRAHET